MKHALIIGGDCETVEALEDNIWDAGYHSIVRVGSDREAWGMTDTLRPSLIVVSPDGLPDGAIGQLFGLSQVTGAPVIVAGARPDKALQCLKSGVSTRTPARTEAFRAAVSNRADRPLQAALLPFPTAAASHTHGRYSA